MNRQACSFHEFHVPNVAASEFLGQSFTECVLFHSRMIPKFFTYVNKKTIAFFIKPTDTPLTNPEEAP